MFCSHIYIHRTYIYSCTKNEIGSYKLELVLDGRLRRIQRFWSTAVSCCCMYFVCLFVRFSLISLYVMFMYDLWLYAERPMQGGGEKETDQENETTKRTPFECNVASSLHFRRSLLFERILSLRFLCTDFFLFTHIVYTVQIAIYTSGYIYRFVSRMSVPVHTLLLVHGIVPFKPRHIGFFGVCVCLWVCASVCARSFFAMFGLFAIFRKLRSIFQLTNVRTVWTVNCVITRNYCENHWDFL